MASKNNFADPKRMIYRKRVTDSVRRWLQTFPSYNRVCTEYAAAELAKVQAPVGDRDRNRIIHELAKAVERTFAEHFPKTDEAVLNDLLLVAMVEVDWEEVARPHVLAGVGAIRAPMNGKAQSRSAKRQG